MDPENAHPLESRPPTLEDLLKLCRSLNEYEVKYLIVGGMAVIQHGFTRATEDIDLLVEASPENFRLLGKALEILPDKAIRQVDHKDLAEYLVVRVADEVVIDLMLKACGIPYEEACQERQTHLIEGVSIPIVSANMLLRMKQTLREKDELDRIFLQEKLQKEKSK